MEHQSTVFKTLDLPGGTLVPFSSVRGERVRVYIGPRLADRRRRSERLISGER